MDGSSVFFLLRMEGGGGEGERNGGVKVVKVENKYMLVSFLLYKIRSVKYLYINKNFKGRSTKRTTTKSSENSAMSKNVQGKL